VVHHAVIASDKAIKGGESVCVQLPDGKKDFVARSSVSFGAHVAAMVVQDGRFVLQLQCSQPAGGSACITIGPKYHEKDKRGKQAVLASNYIVNDRVRVRLCNRQDAKQAKEFLLPWQQAVLPQNVCKVGNQLVLHPAAAAPASPPPSTAGRVVKYHRADPLKHDPASDTVSVAFGCETGACLWRAAAACMCCV
jgi:hypothetical protein